MRGGPPVAIMPVIAAPRERGDRVISRLNRLTSVLITANLAPGITMEEAGANFRGTRDLDIVLHVEALTPEFGIR